MFFNNVLLHQNVTLWRQGVQPRENLAAPRLAPVRQHESHARRICCKERSLPAGWGVVVDMELRLYMQAESRLAVGREEGGAGLPPGGQS
jgi:hypothetical protein